MNTIRPTLVEIHTADIHFGAMDPKVQYDILMEQLVNKVATIHFDIFYINGDLFHHKFMGNSDVIFYASLFIDNVVNLCRSKGASLIILHGTASHDAGQLKLFYHYLANNNDIFIIDHAQFIITKGKRILCLPEEYNKGAFYYRQFLWYSGYYDSVCMHGNLKGAIYGCDAEDLGSNKNPTFDINSFEYCMGPIIAGHVHIGGCYQEHMYYSGSPLRWQFGEEQAKGFLIVIHNLQTHQYTVSMEEIKSFRYDTINLDEMIDCDPKEIINYLAKLKREGIDFVKVRFTKYNPSTITALKSYYKLNTEVTIDASDVEFEKTIQENQKEDEKYSKYSYLTEPNLSPTEILVRYINDQKGCEFITTDELIKILSDAI